MSKPIKIGMTSGRKYEWYAHWMRQDDETLEILPMDYHLDNLSEFESCDAFVFTGGEDVHPGYYGAQEYLKYCPDADFDQRRDAFELELLEKIQDRPAPLLGICRGLQLVNVFLGGTLIPDLPTWGKFRHNVLPSGVARDHAVHVDPHSHLYQFVQEKEGIINSLHHQSADRIGAGLVASAVSADGVVEALEPMEMYGVSFLCLVQWHPERMAFDNPFVKHIRDAFINAIRNERIDYY